MKALEKGQSIIHTQAFLARSVICGKDWTIHFVILSVELRSVQIIVNLTSCGIYRK